jgi:enoyl-CoA hydratase/carnithine racemase
LRSAANSAWFAHISEGRQISLNDITGPKALVLYERVGKIAYVRLNRPDKLNAFTDDSVVALRQAWERFDDDDEAWVAIVSGNGRAFSTGADVYQRQLKPREELERLGGPDGGVRAGRLSDARNSKPVIAAVHGYAFGMALGLMLECDLAVVTEDAILQITEVPRGLWGHYHWISLQFRGSMVFADEVVLTGRRFTGREAADHGVVTRAVSPGGHIAAAEELANQMLENPPLAVRAATRARRWHIEEAQRFQLMLREGMPLHLTEDFRESASAFVENREHRPYLGR